MPEISKITLPSGTTYDIKDATAREMASGVIHLIEGVNTTELVDGASTNPIMVNGHAYTAKKGDATFWNNKEFVFDGSIWHEFGDLTGLKALAYKDTASTSYTPTGDVSKPSFTGEEATISVSGTPQGTISTPTFTGDSLTSTGSYTPSGEVSTPTISLKTAGGTATVNSITNIGTLPSLSTTVENENLTISFSQGALPTKGADVTVKVSDAEYESSQPTFTGEQGSISVTGTPEGSISTPTFTGSSLTSTGAYTPVGDVSKPTFTGDAKTITVS